MRPTIKRYRQARINKTWPVFYRYYSFFGQQVKLVKQLSMDRRGFEPLLKRCQRPVLPLSLSAQKKLPYKLHYSVLCMTTKGITDMVEGMRCPIHQGLFTRKQENKWESNL